MITRTTCRVCDGFFEPVLSLGEQYVSNFLKPTEVDGIKAPLDLVLCKTCSLLQLKHTMPCNAMYSNYWYRSGTNQTMRAALADIAHAAEKRIYLHLGDAVLDIGCNDGTLLDSYKTENILKVGFDPAENLAPLSQEVMDRLVIDFFTADKYPASYPHPKIVTSIAMFYDLEDPNKFVGDVKKIMHLEGIWIIQMSYLPLMLKQHDFGNICHEHLEYYSLKSLECLLHRHNLEVFDVELNDINGGSFRVFIQNKGTGPISTRVDKMRGEEEDLLLGTRKPYVEFATWIKRIREDVFRFIDAATDRGEKVALYGASTKGNTMLQYFGLPKDSIVFASERNPDKWGLVTVGTRIPIVSEKVARATKPDYFLVLPWHFLEEFKEREKDYLGGGGRFIVPLPHFTLI